MLHGPTRLAGRQTLNQGANIEGKPHRPRFELFGNRPHERHRCTSRTNPQFPIDYPITRYPITRCTIGPHATQTCSRAESAETGRALLPRHGIRETDLCVGSGGTDPTTGTIADTVEQQTEQCLKNVQTILEAAGSGL